MLSWIGTAYLVFNALRLMFRVPHVMRAARGWTGARGISLAGWSFWLLCNLAVGVWASLVPDALLAVTGFAAALADAAVVAFTVRMRRIHLRSRMRAARVTPSPTPDYLIAPPTVPSYRVVD